MAVPSPAAKPVKTTTARTPYFLFSEENREAAKESLAAAKEPATKISVADVAKELGRRWKLLTDAEREEFKARCQAAAAARAAEAGQDGQEEGATSTAPEAADNKAGSSHAKPQGLPVSLVKKIACLDEDVTRVSHDAMVVMARATELFLELMAEKCGKVLTSSKPRRSTVKLSDLGEVIKRDRRLVAAGLRDVMAMAQERADKAAEVRAAAAGEQAASQEGGEGEADKAATGGKVGRPSNKRKAEQAPASSRPITAFFAKTAS